MAQAKQGDTVRVHYTGKLQDGSVFDSSVNADPLQFQIGGGQVIPGFEAAVLDMNPGESKIATIPPTQAYGARQDELLVQVDRSQFPPNVEPEVGQRLTVRSQDNQQIPVTVTNVGDSQVTLDANHPLAGETLTFELQLVEIV